MSVTFSIIVPVYNVVQYLPACIDSIVGQHRSDTEVIVINDASTDDSAAICDRYAREYDSVRVIHLEKNQGVAAARNQGLAAARGDYLIFVDGDDCLVDGSLERARQLIERIGETDIVICRFCSESKVLSNDAMFLSSVAQKLDAETVLNHLTRIDFYLDHCWPYVINRSLIVRNDVHFIRSTIAEDAEYIVRLFALASSVAYNEGDFYLYRERDGSLKNSKGVAETVSFLQVAHAMRTVMDAAGRSDAQKAFLASQIRHSLGAFSARLSMLDDDAMDGFSPLIGPEQLPPALTPASPGGLSVALRAYRQTIEAATLSLVAAAGQGPLYVYCTGPSGEAAVRTLLGAGYVIRNVIDDNEKLSGRTVLGVPIVTGAQFFAKAPEEVACAFVVVCIQKKAAYEKISQSLIGRGVARERIVHRMF
jgi:hypothetical protein